MNGIWAKTLEKMSTLVERNYWTAIIYLPHSAAFKFCVCLNPKMDQLFEESISAAAQAGTLVAVYTRDCPRNWIMDDLEFIRKRY
jgi:hypothetical protein